MINTVEVRTAQGDLLALPVGEVEGGIGVQDIEGLDPVRATIVSSSFAQLDGGQYQSSRRDERNIKIALGLYPDYLTETVRSLRKRLYRYFMTKSEVNLRFYDSDGLVVEIAGRVESLDTVLFSDTPEAVISILCFNPDFAELNSEVLSGTTVETSTETTVVYDGSVETGIQFKIFPDRSVSEFTVYHRPPDGSLRQLDFSSPLIAGDEVTVSTAPGAKSATLKRSGVDTSVLYALSPQSNWIELQPGTNYIRVYAVGNPIPYQIEYTNKHGGL